MLTRHLLIGSCALALLAGCSGQAKNPPAASAEPVAASAQPVAKATPLKYASFGAPMKLSDAETLTVDKVLANPREYDGKYVRVAGTVASVCPKKGCWMRLNNGQSAQTLFVKFPDPAEGRLIPMDAVGKPAIAEGTLHVQEISEATARHYKQDAGASQEEIEKIVGPELQIAIKNGSAKIAEQ
jgi:hypothetical protein